MHFCGIIKHRKKMPIKLFLTEPCISDLLLLFFPSSNMGAIVGSALGSSKLATK
jgi:hypothetical protein